MNDWRNSMSNFVYSIEINDDSISSENIDKIMSITENGINKALDIIRDESPSTILDMLGSLSNGDIEFNVSSPIDILAYGIVLEFISGQLQ